MSERFGDLLPTPRILLGRGPTMADPRVLRAMATPLLGQFDPEFTAIMNEVMALTRFAFRTANGHAFPVSGSGRAGMEAAIVSLCSPASASLAALEHVLRGEGFTCAGGAGVDAAIAHYASAGARPEGGVSNSLGATGIGRL